MTGWGGLTGSAFFSAAGGVPEHAARSKQRIVRNMIAVRFNLINLWYPNRPQRAKMGQKWLFCIIMTPDKITKCGADYNGSIT